MQCPNVIIDGRLEARWAILSWKISWLPALEVPSLIKVKINLSIFTEATWIQG